MVSNEDLAKTLKTVVHELKRIVDEESSVIDSDQKQSLMLLYEYYQRNLNILENSIGEANAEDSAMVEKLKSAIEIMHEDDKITQKEIEEFVRIAADLQITKTELDGLKKAGQD